MEPSRNDNILEKILTELSNIENKMESIKAANALGSDWLTRKDVMTFLDYGDTQMASFEKSPDLVVSKIGKRKFIHKSSLLKLLQNHIQK